MAITKSAKKEIRASARKRIFNIRCLRTMRVLIKDVMQEHRAGDVEKTRAKYSKAQQAIDKAAKRGVIKERSASRKKAALSRAIHSSNTSA